MYSFRTPNANKGRLAVYAAVLLVFVLSAGLLLSGNNPKEKEQASGYLVAKDSPSPKPTTQIDAVQGQLDKLKTDIAFFSSNLTSCYEGTSSLTISLQSCKSDTAICQADFAKLSANKTVAEQVCLNEKVSLQLSLSTAEARATALNKTLSETATNYDSLKKQYTSLASNSANNICCKARVDNANIKFYNIASDKISCSESSGTSLNC